MLFCFLIVQFDCKGVFMLRLLLIIISLLFITNTKAILAQNINPKYDSLLAKKLGADEHGMKKYVFVLIKSGANTSTDKAYKDSCFAGHFRNINKLAAQGKLIVAGPIQKNEKAIRGIFILDVLDFEEAKILLADDTAIKEGFLDYDLFFWYGSAALPMYLETSEKINKFDIK